MMRVRRASGQQRRNVGYRSPWRTAILPPPKVVKSWDASFPLIVPYFCRPLLTAARGSRAPLYKPLASGGRYAAASGRRTSWPPSWKYNVNRCAFIWRTILLNFISVRFETIAFSNSVASRRTNTIHKNSRYINDKKDNIYRPADKNQKMYIMQ